METNVVIVIVTAVVFVISVAGAIVSFNKEWDKRFYTSGGIALVCSICFIVMGAIMHHWWWFLFAFGIFALIICGLCLLTYGYEEPLYNDEE